MSCYMWLTLLNSKAEAAAAIKRFKGVAELEANAKLQTLRTDQSDEFISHDLADFCADQGVKRHMTMPYSLQ
jgi:transposase InsO family protein